MISHYVSQLLLINHFLGHFTVHNKILAGDETRHVRRDLLNWILFQLLIGNNDAHGKNIL